MYVVNRWKLHTWLGSRIWKDCYPIFAACRLGKQHNKQKQRNWIHWLEWLSAMAARFFSVQHTKKGGNMSNDHKICQMAGKNFKLTIQYTNIYNSKALQNLPKFGFFWLEKIPSGSTGCHRNLSKAPPKLFLPCWLQKSHSRERYSKKRYNEKSSTRKLVDPNTHGPSAETGRSQQQVDKWARRRH
jgi:hypothetical protein